MLVSSLIVVGVIVIIFFYESINDKGTQPVIVRLKLISLQVICTLALTLLIVIFFSDVLQASQSQIEIVGAIACVISYLVCAYAFRRNSK